MKKKPGGKPPPGQGYTAGLPSQQWGWEHLCYPHSPLVCLLANGTLLFAVTGGTERGGDMVKRIGPSQGGFVSTQLVTNNPDGTTGLGPKGNQVGRRKALSTLARVSLGPQGGSGMSLGLSDLACWVTDAKNPGKLERPSEGMQV